VSSKYTAEGLPFPEGKMLERIGPMGDEDPKRVYEVSGRGHRALIENLLPDDWSWTGRRVLDFGCGVGRIIRQFAPEAEEAEFWGCDIDAPSVDWLRQNLSPPFNFFRSEETPGLPQEDGYFDLIYVFSVYTHLTEHWAGWLLEHHRVLKDGGYMFVTFLGEGMWEPYTQEPWDENTVGMNTLLHGYPWDLGGPITMNSPWWIRAHWGRAFEIVELLPHGGGAPPEGHGLVLMRKKPVQLTIEDLQRPEPDEPREIAAMQHHIEQMRKETLGLREQVAYLQGQVDNHARVEQLAARIQASKSWRLTAPLRSAKRRLSR
jgi:SAM-dependent methyltransferase